MNQNRESLFHGASGFEVSRGDFDPDNWPSIKVQLFGKDVPLSMLGKASVAARPLLACPESFQFIHSLTHFFFWPLPLLALFVRWLSAQAMIEKLYRWDEETKNGQIRARSRSWPSTLTMASVCTGTGALLDSTRIRCSCLPSLCICYST